MPSRAKNSDLLSKNPASSSNAPRRQKVTFTSCVIVHTVSAPKKLEQREGQTNQVPEIDFTGEGYAHAIKSGKYSTLRLTTNPLYKTLRPGDKVEAVCKVNEGDDNPTRVPLIILATEKSPLGEQDRLVLSTNGFLTHKGAVERLSEIYGKKVSLDDETINIVYLPKDVFDSLPPKQQTLCLILPADMLVRDKRTREIFLPSIFYTFAYEGMTPRFWLDYCLISGILGLAERNRLVSLVMDDHYIGPEKAAALFSNPESMWNILDAKEYAIYDRLVLFQPVKQDGLSTRKRLIKA